MRKIMVFYIFLLIVLLLLIVAPLVLGTVYWTTLLYTLLLHIILAESWNIIGGFGGQVFLGTAAFFGWGAYTSAMLYYAGVPFAACILLAGFSAACLAFILTPTFKLRGVYFVVGSLFISEIMKTIVLTLPIFGGAAGIMLPVFRERVLFTYYSAFLLMLVVFLITLFITRSKIGIALRAIRDDQEAAEIFGINSTMFKLLALVITSLLCGMAGGIHAFYMIYVEPHSFFSISWNIIPVFTVLIGGTSTIMGPIIGTAIYTLLRELFIFVTGEIYLTVLGALLIVVMLIAPSGVYPAFTKAIHRVQKRIR
ncbi:MAG: branched-chain amino acid ABC transporter permease [Candidatus Bathyarchaeia archaeon]|nr:branched-chain amino acid ABC transporter permease [Candidatus Bathyarchaeota archaeon]